MRKQYLRLGLCSTAFVFGLLTSALASTPAQTILATPSKPNSGQPAASAITLTLKDLPTGFQEVPQEIKPQIDARLEPFKQLLVKENLPVENFFAFVEPQKLEVVIGFTGMLPEPSQQRKFDATLQQLQQPQVRQQIISKIQEQLQQYQGVKVLGQQALPQLENIGDTSAGISLAVALRKQPVRVDMGSFRRGRVGVTTAVVYLDKTVPVVPVRDVATKLDNRILQSSASRHSSYFWAGVLK